MNPRRKILTLYLIIPILSFLLLETGLRVVLAIRTGPRAFYYGLPFQRHKVELDTVVFHKNLRQGYTKFYPNESKVDSDLHGAVFKVSINKRGFRGREIDEAKKPGVIRIATLGSSSTFGFTDRDKETYPYYLEQRLNEDKGANPGFNGGFEVINLGVPHLVSEEILALFFAEALPLNPDVVTFYEGINDSRRGNPRKSIVSSGSQENEVRHNPLRKKLSGVAPLKSLYGIVRDHVLILAFLDNLLQESSVLSFDSKQVEDHINGTSEHFLHNVDDIYRECQRRRILFVAIKQQAKSYIVPNIKGIPYTEEARMVRDKLNTTGAITSRELYFLTHGVVNTALENWAITYRVPFLDAVKLLDRDRDVLVSYVHLSPRGNRMIADALAQEIERDLSAHPPVVRSPGHVE